MTARAGRVILLAAMTLLVTAASAVGQEGGLEEWASSSAENDDIFRQLDLPAPNSYRNGAGGPGEDYWQQQVDYDIDVRLHPDSNVVGGSETITYTNNSPSELDHLWLQLDQNLFDLGSEGMKASEQAPLVLEGGEGVPGVFPGGGYEISDVRVTVGGETAEPEFMIDGTVMRVTLPEPLPADGGQAKLSLDFRFEVPRSGSGRMGRLDVKQGTVYELGQWYPRMFAYDDAHGWNVMPYLGKGEFYLEYGSFDVEITAPREFVVVGTGRLTNGGQVLTDTQRRRLERARNSSETVHLIRENEAGDPSARPSGQGPLTWRFRADSVRDFAWAASEAFVWDAASWNDVLIMSAYPSEGLGSGDEPGWEHSTRMLRHSVSYYSEQWGDYPYPVAINVAGRAQGMEYPMVFFTSVEARGDRLLRITDHEAAHTWFPMLVGSDERRHHWMDEGLVTFMGLYSREAYGESGGEGASVADSVLAARTATLTRKLRNRLPILTYSDRFSGPGYALSGYRKAGRGLVLLREVVLGPDRFDPALREYIDRWKHRHPKPADFFRTIEDVAGEELDWFWQGWFDGTKTLDQSVDDVAVSGDTTRITLEQEGLVMPLRVRLEYADGSTATRRIPVEAWHTSDTFTATVIGPQVRSVTVDPENRLPDVERGNDGWRAVTDGGGQE
ncbi:MAG: M1 family metallopeptidase [Candidatus Palauibacterales bacterium]|nr:M1 family metallopeptidase [Candidatus Palauibacterales bacterium]